MDISCEIQQFGSFSKLILLLETYQKEINRQVHKGKYAKISIAAKLMRMKKFQTVSNKKRLIKYIMAHSYNGMPCSH